MGVTILDNKEPIVSPFSVGSDETKECSLGGSMKISLGSVTQGQGANGAFILEYIGSKLTFQNCKESVPSAERGKVLRPLRLTEKFQEMVERKLLWVISIRIPVHLRIP